MEKTIRMHVGGDPGQLVEKARAAAAESGAEFEGDAASGRFAASGVEGRYEFEEGAVTITVTRMPALVPWPLVEAKLKGFFS